MTVGPKELIFLPTDRPGVRVAALAVAAAARWPDGGLGLLGPEERDACDRLGHPKRRAEWIAARVCVKELLLRAGLIGDPQACVIRKNERGRPHLVGWGSSAAAEGAACSISHKGEYVLAGISPAGTTRLGVDIERIGPKPGRLRDAFVHQADALTIDRARDMFYTALWSIKEAASKAWGLGIGIGLTDLVCTEQEPGHCAVRHARWGEVLTAQFDFRGNYAWAVATAA